jgi:hypothetical protein
MPNYRTPDEARPSLEKLVHFLLEAGRERSSFGIEARIPFGNGDPETWHELMQAWQAAGATHISFNTMGASLQTPAAHLNALQKIAASIGINTVNSE